MKAHDVILQMFDTARFITSTYLSDISDEELLISPVPGAHHMAWQLGHLLLSECSMIDGIRAGVAPQLPPRFSERHSKESESSADAGQFLSKAEYLTLMTRVREATRGLLAQFTEEQLDAPGPQAVRAYAPTIGSVFLMIGSHEIMHSGQLAVIRRKLGKAVVI